MRTGIGSASRLGGIVSFGRIMAAGGRECAFSTISAYLKNLVNGNKQ